MTRRIWKWTPKQLDKLDKVYDVLNSLEDYLPLTLRQIYYQLVSKGHIENKKSEYNMLSQLLKWARIHGYVSWDVIEDRIRPFHKHNGWANISNFLRYGIDSFLKAYSRNFWQDQSKYIEVWIEKDALSSIFSRICLKYGVSVAVCRGFSSVSFQHDFKLRLERYPDKEYVMLYFGDFDPSGIEMLASMETTLTAELGVTGVEFKRVALVEQDITDYNLPHDPSALKKTDPRAAKHLAEYGQIAVELDALSPMILEQEIVDAITLEITDTDAYEYQVDLYVKELEEMEQLKRRIVQVL